MVPGGSWRRKKTGVGGNLVSITFKISATHRTISELTFVSCIGNRQMQILPVEKFCSS